MEKHLLERHNFKFYDFKHLNENSLDEVYMCECGARVTVIVNWTGKSMAHDSLDEILKHMKYREEESRRDKALSDYIAKLEQENKELKRLVKNE